MSLQPEHIHGKNIYISSVNQRSQDAVEEVGWVKIHKREGIQLKITKKHKPLVYNSTSESILEERNNTGKTKKIISEHSLFRVENFVP